MGKNEQLEQENVTYHEGMYVDFVLNLQNQT